ncbi:vascular endothelial growth factor C-like [Acipenser oxyrinchus oxyrinchus]|uniref:Vascular endothelial growth factor C-like n=1 Tax=Acipenser oxyrinchus oxyrinchus TaxID=40147 RepID=A0AAD8FW04_ACIOX|nr:vascular endothelial growth factor C-like [Acipenser oxyrinchus oxyrinchus]
MWRFHIYFWILPVFTPRCGSQSGHYEYYKEREETEGQLGSDLVEQMQFASSLDELLDLLYPEYRLLQQCLHRKAALIPHEPSSEEAARGYVKEAPLYAGGMTEESLQSIMLEYEKTQCTPREVCLDITKEFPESTVHFYKPSCVSVHRCGGCCNHEGWHCTNSSHNYSSKTLLEFTVPPSGHPEIVMISFVNHTSCECKSKSNPSRSPHSVIRRSIKDKLARCAGPDSSCPPGLSWDPVDCQCVPDDMSAFGSLSPESCRPDQSWDEKQCGCVCRDSCPSRQPLNPVTCQCECKESDATCLLLGKKFNPNTCSCYRLPCRTQNRRCASGFYFSHYVCHCIPNYMRSY